MNASALAVVSSCFIKRSLLCWNFCYLLDVTFLIKNVCNGNWQMLVQYQWWYCSNFKQVSFCHPILSNAKCVSWKYHSNISTVFKVLGGNKCSFWSEKFGIFTKNNLIPAWLALSEKSRFLYPKIPNKLLLVNDLIAQPINITSLRRHKISLHCNSQLAIPLQS